MKQLNEVGSTITITDDETGETVEKSVKEILDDIFGNDEYENSIEFDVEDNQTDDLDVDDIVDFEDDYDTSNDIDLTQFDFEELEDDDMDDLSSDIDTNAELELPATMDDNAEFDPQNEYDDDDLMNDETSSEDINTSLSDLPTDDPNFQGELRTVVGANLVYKRADDNGTFEELWVYNVGSEIKQEVQIRRAILAGTDISPASRESEDGTQQVETTTLGNVQFMKITGLPN